MPNKKNNQNIIGATITHIIVAFVYVFILDSIVYLLFWPTISRAISLLDTISVSTNKTILKDVKIDFKTKNLKSYPEYGAKYGTLKIPSLNIDLPLYFGDTLDVLKNGVGHSSFSYFPGEGGTVLCMAHNTSKMLKKLPKIENSAQIIIETTYGKYTYELYETRIVKETELEAAPIQRDKEILILYTCYPVSGIGHATSRFLVYANLVNEENFEE